jgi:hypothetical protein
LTVTPELIELALVRHGNRLKARDEWITPTGLLIAVVLAFATADFQDFLGIKGNVWEAVFLISAGLSAIWLVRSLQRRYKAGKDDPAQAILKELRKPPTQR